jgi:hypothetical protein
MATSWRWKEQSDAFLMRFVRGPRWTLDALIFLSISLVVANAVKLMMVHSFLGRLGYGCALLIYSSVFVWIIQRSRTLRKRI